MWPRLVLCAVLLFASGSVSWAGPKSAAALWDRKTPGAADGCCVRMSPDKAFKIIQDMKAQKINYSWYTFFTPKLLNGLSLQNRWRFIISFACAVNSLYGSNSDVYISLVPSKAAGLAMRLGQRQHGLLAAEALYQWSATTEAGGACPPGTLKRIYRFIVYDR